jgi:anti-anti-sigma factor
MGLKVEKIGHVVVLKLRSGMYTGGDETDELYDKLGELVDEEERKILLDLADVTHMTSIPIGLLARRGISAQKKGLTMALCNVTKRIEDVIVIVALGRLFTLYGSREEALRQMQEC